MDTRIRRIRLGWRVRPEATYGRRRRIAGRLLRTLNSLPELGHQLGRMQHREVGRRMSRRIDNGRT